MVGLIGIEPMTSTMSTWRSNQLSYNPKCISIMPKESAFVNSKFNSMNFFRGGCRFSRLRGRYCFLMRHMRPLTR